MRKTSSSGVVWQVIAPVVRWPLWSPTRFFLSLAAVAALCVGLSVLHPDDVDAPPAPAYPTSSSTSTPASTPTVTRPTSRATEGMG